MTKREILAQYLPEAAVDNLLNRIIEKKVHLKITRNRKTKLGDYRPPARYANHRISVNYDLNPYAFLITLVHELAHLVVYEQFENQVSPHGKEWKIAYREMMQEFLIPEIFPPELLKAVESSLYNAKASTFTDLELSRILKTYDKPNGQIVLESLPAETVFVTQGGKKFIKGEKLRKRYKCLNLQNRRLYLFQPLTPVIPVEK